MTTGLAWENEGSYMYSDEMSDTLRTVLQTLTKFRQFCEPDAGATAKGLHRGQSYRWNIYGDLAVQGRRLNEHQPMPETNFTVDQAELTVIELGNSVH